MCNENEFNIEKVITTAKELKNGFFFTSERDFQFMVGVAIKTLYKNATVIMEYRYPGGALIETNERQYIDILVIMDDKYYPIELKYKHKGVNVEIAKDLDYELKPETCTTDHRKKYIDDIDRLSKLKNVKIGEFEFLEGYAVLLTNWEQIREESSKREQKYSLQENEINSLVKKINKKCNNAISDMKWYDYDNSKKFSYLITTIN